MTFNSCSLRLLLWVIAVFSSLSLCTAQTSPCTQTGTLSSVTSYTSYNNTATNAATCNVWALTWSTTGYSAITIQLEGSDNNTTFAAFTGATVVTAGTNPASTASGTIKINATSQNAYVRVNLTAATGSGTVKFQLRGSSGILSLVSPGGGVPAGAAGGDLCGTYPNPTVCKVNGAAVPASAAVTGTNASRQIIAAALPSGDLWVGSAGNLPVPLALSGDCTLSNLGVVTCASFVRNNTTNTGTAAFTLDASASTSANAVKVPVIAGAAPSQNGAIAYDSTGNNVHAALGNADAVLPGTTINPTNNDCVTWIVAGGQKKLGSAGAGCGTSAAGGSVGSTFFSSVTQAGPSNDATQTSLVGTVVGSQTIAANVIGNGTLIKVEANGFYSLPSPTPDNLTLRVKCGSTIIASGTFASGISTGLTNGAFRLWLDITGIGSGAGGAFASNGLADFSGSSSGTNTGFSIKLANTSNVSYNFTTSCLLDVTAQWAGAQPSESITGTNVVAYAPGAAITAIGATAPLAVATATGPTPTLSCSTCQTGTPTNHGTAVGSATQALNYAGPGSSGNVLTSNGASADPTYQAVAACASCLTGTPTNHGVAIGGSGQANTYTGAGTTGQGLVSNGPSADPTFQTIPITVASGTSAMGTGAISSATCATVVTTAATGTLTTDVIAAGFNGDPTAVTGYIPSTSGMLTIIPYPSANNVNFKVCNNTNASITPGAITLNWRVAR